MSEGSSAPTPLASWNRARGVWETGQQGVCGHSELFSAIWPTSGMTRGGLAYELPTWERLTADSGSSSPHGLLPTPAAGNFNDGESVESWQARKAREGGHGPTLADEVEFLLPTPKTTDAHHSSPADMNRNAPGLRAIQRLLPTPRATDGTKGGPNQRGSSGDLMLPSAVTQLGDPTSSPSDDGS